MNFILDAGLGSEPGVSFGPPWTQLSLVAQTGSTNADLVAAARAGAESGSVLVAAHQTSGRGRLDRSWTAPPGTSLAISVLLRPPVAVPLTRWLWLPLLAGLAVVDALSHLYQLPVELKWPNDVLIDGKKLCGVLAERIVDGGDPALVLGMGVNTRLAADELPVPAATSLAMCGVSVNDGELIEAVLAALGAWYSRWLDGDDLAGVLSQRCGTVGRQVRLHIAGRDSVTGTAVGIDSDGRLLVRAGQGVQAFAAADVVHLR
jgi:BirA family transcriptional regulator, biotin operon repressor / biotin---[acetyl-CoA-carboxylase] ligase